ncbi:unnamed protein product [Clavelina lepadiformis]|uniref:catechol O-methyltransferase n=1 Tax=Clavelina lepadiformis TaxID=159417 RepID=A0ABP0FYR6_CLALP
MPKPGQVTAEGFHLRLLEHVRKTVKPGDASNMIATIDNYCYTVESGMNVGDVKGKILDDIVLETNPTTVLELGTFCGYSALRIARNLPENSRFFTVEFNPEHAAVAKEIIHTAGMDDKIQMLIGPSQEMIPQFKGMGVSHFDLVFVDHEKDLYKPDVILLEKEGLLKKGSVIVADNVVYPGSPDYIDYVRNNPKFKSTNYMSELEYHKDVVDAIEKSIYIG